jgi:hypothetical protein
MTPDELSKPTVKPDNAESSTTGTTKIEARESQPDDVTEDTLLVQDIS